NVAVLSEAQALSGAGAPPRPDEDPTVALARGAAMAAGPAGDATAMAPAVGSAGDATAMAPAVGSAGDATAMAPAVGGVPPGGQVGADLAYSMAGESDLLPMEWLTEPEDDDAQTGPVGLTSRRLGAMDAVLGVAVAGSIARLALVGPVGGGYAAIKHLVVELPIEPFETLIQTVTGAQQALAAEGRHLVATRLYSPDPGQAEAFRQALADSGVPDVGVVSQPDAVAALLRTVFRGVTLPGAVALVVTAEAATLVALGAAGAAEILATAALQGVDAVAAAADMLLDWLQSAPFAVSAAYVLGTLENLTSLAERIRARSALRVEVLERPEFAFARGAALAAGLAPTTPQPPVTAGAATAMAPALGVLGDATAMAPATAAAGEATGIAPTSELAGSGGEEPQLAYSQAEDADPFAGGLDEYGDFPDDAADPEMTSRMPLSRRSLVLGNAVIAFAVVGFATLAAAVAIAIRPTASAQPVIGHQNAAPGKFMPLLPTQQQAPVPPPPIDQPNAGFQGGVIPDANGYIPPQLASPGSAPVAPAPEPVPGLMPNPDGPIPYPVIVPYPGWRPPYNPYPPYTPPTYTPPTTTPRFSSASRRATRIGAMSCTGRRWRVRSRQLMTTVPTRATHGQRSPGTGRRRPVTRSAPWSSAATSRGRSPGSMEPSASMTATIGVVAATTPACTAAP
ncbi:hypothetical protein A5712_08345, partial [Mycobacterium sp. E2327]